MVFRTTHLLAFVWSGGVQDSKLIIDDKIRRSGKWRSELASGWSSEPANAWSSMLASGWCSELVIFQQDDIEY